MFCFRDRYWQKKVLKKMSKKIDDGCDFQAYFYNYIVDKRNRSIRGFFFLSKF